MKRILCTGIALIILLTACAVPSQTPGLESTSPEKYTHGIYRLSFAVEPLPEQFLEGWNIVYTYNGETVTDGERILFPLGIFSFCSVRVDIIERDNPNNQYSATFPIAVCDGGSGFVSSCSMDH